MLGRMPRGPGRPPKPTSIDDDLMAAVRKALLQVARDLHIPTEQYVHAADGANGPKQAEPRALDLAVLAVKAESALELLAAEQINKTRTHHDSTWEQIGDAFGTSAQSAHVRFGKVSVARTAADR